MTLAFHVGPVGFERPAWLWLLIPAVLLTLWIGRKSLSGLGTWVRRWALVIRLIVILLLIGAIARPQWRKESKSVNVIAVLDASRSIPPSVQGMYEPYLDRAADRARRSDTLARVTAAEDAYVQQLPGDPRGSPASQFVGATQGTNLGEAVQLGIAVAPKDAANRIVLLSDGNETAGSLLAAAETARALGMPIDVLAIRYDHDREVVVERLVAPATARKGETVNLRVLINAKQATAGRLSVLTNGEPVDLDADSAGFGRFVELTEGTQALMVPIKLTGDGPQRFEAVFEPTPDESGRLGDTITENNRASNVTFVTTQGRVLVLTPSPEEAAYLVEALQGVQLGVEVRSPTNAPATLVEFNGFDAVVMANVAAYDLSQQQQKDLRAYVHDAGGGLVMVGGPESLGAGGWIGSPVEDALPVKLDPPQKRQMPRGALVLIMHSCEMPQGNYWGQQVAHAAMGNLSRLDLAGVVEYSWNGGDVWVYPLSEVGNGAALRRAINSLTFGDAPSFESMMQLAIKDLGAAPAGQKHCIIISDGDPSPPTRGTIQSFIDAKVSVTTVMVWPHSQSATGPEAQVMQRIATATGGRFYSIVNQAQFAQLPNIFTKEAQLVRRTLIWEGDPFFPAIERSGTEAMAGIRGVPAVSGYVVTAERESGLAQVSLRGQENDPLLASWQYGLGRSVVFASDATSRWAERWLGWGQFGQFWEQHVRWAMRPSGSAELRVFTEDMGDRTKLTVEAIEPGSGERMDFLTWRGRVALQDGAAAWVDLRQVGPGQYEGFFDSADAGSYVVSLRYAQPGEDGRVREGGVQAAFTRSFADEFRALKDNSALLKQVADLTGGRVLSDDPAAADLWRRDGLEMPVALTSVWLHAAVLAMALFLTDVAVRRVRLDFIGAAGRMRRQLMGLERKAEGQITTLKEARARAKEEMAKRGAAEAGAAGAAGAKSAPAHRAAVKFEATEAEIRAAARGAVDVAGGGGPSKEESKKTGKGAAAEGQGEEDSMSRLMKAKKRARDELGE